MFVVTLESGRVKPTDVATMRIVLDAIDVGTQVPFGIVVNKLSQRVLSGLEDKKEQDIALASMMASGANASHIFLNKFEMDLYDQDDVVHDVSPELRTFLRTLPSIYIQEESVSDLQVDTMDDLRAKFEEELSQMRNEAEARETMLAAQVEELKNRPVEIHHHHRDSGCTIL